MNTKNAWLDSVTELNVLARGNLLFLRENDQIADFFIQNFKILLRQVPRLSHASYGADTNSLSQEYTHQVIMSTHQTTFTPGFKHQTLTPTVFHETTHIQMITTHRHHLHLGSNHSNIRH